MIKTFITILFFVIIAFIVFRWATIEIKSEKSYEKYMSACIVENKGIPNPDIFCRSLWKENNR